MERGTLKVAALVVCFSLSASVAESPQGGNEERGGALLSGLLKNPAPSRVVAILAWGEHTMGPNIQRQTTFIRRVATEAERKIAEQNAAAYYAKLSQAQKTEIKKTKRYWAVPITKVKGAPKPGPKIPKEEAPKEDDVMIYDPFSGSIVNKYVYTIKSIPAPETPMSVDGYEPLLYVGR
jgi:hypothetical protein